MNNCNIINNGDYEIFTSACNDPETIIDATNNWWGVDNLQAIEPLVYHQPDDPNLPVVDFDPFIVDSLNISVTFSEYMCGDANADKVVNVGDAVYILSYIFNEGPVPLPVDAGNVNCDESVNVGDAVYMVNFIFKEGSPGPCEACE